MFIVKLGLILLLMILGVCIGSVAVFAGAKLAYMQFDYDSLIPVFQYAGAIAKLTGTIFISVFICMMILYILFVILTLFWVLFVEMFKLIFWFMF